MKEKLIKNNVDDNFYKIIDRLKYNDISVNLQNQEGNSLIMLACKYGRLDIVKALIYLGANLDLLNKDQENAIKIASKFNYINIVEFLLENGADITVGNQDFSCS